MASTDDTPHSALSGATRTCRFVVISPAPTAKVPVLSSITAETTIVALLPSGYVLDGGSEAGAWISVQLPSGMGGFVARANLRPLEDPPLATRTDAISQSPAHQHLSLAPSSAEAATARAGSLILTITGVVLVVGGLVLATVVSEACPISGGQINPYSTSCTVTGVPFGTAGAVAMGTGIVLLLLAFLLGRRTHL